MHSYLHLTILKKYCQIIQQHSTAQHNIETGNTFVFRIDFSITQYNVTIKGYKRLKQILNVNRFRFFILSLFFC